MVRAMREKAYQNTRYPEIRDQSLIRSDQTGNMAGPEEKIIIQAGLPARAEKLHQVAAIN